MKTTIEAYKKNVSFTDASNNLVFIEISVENGRLSMSGNCNGSGGQIVDSIKPANQAQKDLIAIWREWHLNDMHAGTEEQEAALQTEEFKKFETTYTARITEAKKIQTIANMSLDEYVTHINAWKKEKGVRSYPIACKEDLDHIKKLFKLKHACGKHFRDLRHKMFMGEQKFPFRNVNFTVLGDTPLLDILSDTSPSHYTAACAYLKSKVLYTVMHNSMPYTYGHGCLTQSLPADICERLDAITEAMEAFTGSPYEKQANDLLKSMGIEFEANFKRHGKHFADDTERRDIFDCQFYRVSGHNLVITFGQSIANSDGKGGTPPTAYDVLACITKSNPGSFENFCSEYGYNTDRHKAESIHASVCEEWRNVSDFFKPSEIKKLQDIA